MFVCTSVLLYILTGAVNALVGNVLRPHGSGTVLAGPVCVCHLHSPVLHAPVSHLIQLVTSKLVCTNVAAVSKTVVHVV